MSSDERNILLLLFSKLKWKNTNTKSIFLGVFSYSYFSIRKQEKEGERNDVPFVGSSVSVIVADAATFDVDVVEDDDNSDGDDKKDIGSDGLGDTVDVVWMVAVVCVSAGVNIIVGSDAIGASRENGDGAICVVNSTAFGVNADNMVCAVHDSGFVCDWECIDVIVVVVAEAIARDDISSRKFVSAMKWEAGLGCRPPLQSDSRASCGYPSAPEIASVLDDTVACICLNT